MSKLTSFEELKKTPQSMSPNATEIVGLEGRSRLERVRWRDSRTGRTETPTVAHVFVMTGAVTRIRVVTPID